MEQKMNSALKKDDSQSEGTEPVGHFRNDQIVRVDHEPDTLPFQDRESDRRSGKSQNSNRSRKKRPQSRERNRSRGDVTIKL